MNEAPKMKLPRDISISKIAERLTLYDGDLRQGYDTLVQFLHYLPHGIEICSCLFGISIENPSEYSDDHLQISVSNFAQYIWCKVLEEGFTIAQFCRCAKIVYREFNTFIKNADRVEKLFIKVFGVSLYEFLKNNNRTSNKKRDPFDWVKHDQKLDQFTKARQSLRSLMVRFSVEKDMVVKKLFGRTIYSDLATYSDILRARKVVTDCIRDTFCMFPVIISILKVNPYTEDGFMEMKNRFGKSKMTKKEKDLYLCNEEGYLLKKGLKYCLEDACGSNQTSYFAIEGFNKSTISNIVNYSGKVGAAISYFFKDVKCIPGVKMEDFKHNAFNYYCYSPFWDFDIFDVNERRSIGHS